MALQRRIKTIPPGQLHPPCKFPPGQLPPKTKAPPPREKGKLPPPPPITGPPPQTITPWTTPSQTNAPRQLPPANSLPDNCPPPPDNPPPGESPHITRNFFCFCFGTRSLSAFSVRPWVHFQGRVQLELEYIRLLNFSCDHIWSTHVE